MGVYIFMYFISMTMLTPFFSVCKTLAPLARCQLLSPTSIWVCWVWPAYPPRSYRNWMLGSLPENLDIIHQGFSSASLSLTLFFLLFILVVLVIIIIIGISISVVIIIIIIRSSSAAITSMKCS